MAAAYTGMHLWAKGVEAAHSDQVADIRKAMVQQQFEAPEGLVRIDPKNQRAVRRSGIGQIGDDLEFDVISMSPKPITPVAFPPTRSRQAWEQFVDSLYARWGGWTPNGGLPEPVAGSGQTDTPPPPQDKSPGQDSSEANSRD